MSGPAGKETSKLIEGANYRWIDRTRDQHCDVHTRSRPVEGSKRRSSASVGMKRARLFVPPKWALTRGKYRGSAWLTN